MISTGQDKMLPQERRATYWLASIYALRMFGLFSILPVFAIYARSMPGGHATYMVALALSIYGLTQALLYVAYGAASDRFGRKPVIVIGLVVFALGSVVAALSDNIVGVVFGRALQGAGAVSSAITAFVADSTRDSVRSKAMATVGASIGITFALALIISPPLTAAVGLAGMFWLTGALACVAIGVVLFCIPEAPALVDSSEMSRPGDVLFHPQLFRLNFGVFVLHATLMSVFVVVPPMLVDRAQIEAANHWMVYLPVIVLSFGLMIKPMLAAERRGKVTIVFRCAVGLLLLSFLLGPYAITLGRWGLIAFLLTFFIAFNLLEALQPSLVSRIAPAHMKGFAMGVYNTTQAAGLFLGGLLGGVVAKRMSESFVFAVCALLVALWLAIAWNTRAPEPQR
jgi:MFS family permease